MGEDAVMDAERELFQLNNDELAAAIEWTYVRIRQTGTGCASYQPLVGNFKALLAEQLKRAT